MRVVVAIDFGTSRTGHAYAFPDDREKKVYLRERWPNQQRPYPKTLTNLLYAPDGRLAAWGWGAIFHLARLRTAQDRAGYRHLRGFKMQLKSERSGPRGPEFEQYGRTYAVIDLIADYLRRVREDLMPELQQAATGGVRADEIIWCLTVPAIWTNEDRSAMRRAAVLAGLVTDDNPGQLIFALEPEAAAVYCQKRDAAVGGSQLLPGKRFMVVDAGGGTVDLTVHEVTATNRFKEVVEGSGGACGSTYLDGEFTTFLTHLLGHRLYTELTETEPVEYLDLLRQWEAAKCEYTGGDDDWDVPIAIPVWLLGKLYEPANHAALTRLRDMQGGDDRNIQLTPARMRALFAPVLDEIRKTVEGQFRKLEGSPCDYLFLVGGFAESPALQRMIRDEFGGRAQVIVPPDPGRAVVVGAAHFALDPALFDDRLSRLTYGCQVLRKFRTGDPEDKRVREPGMPDRCEKVFNVLVTAGDRIPYNHFVEREYDSPTDDEVELSVALHATRERAVRYTDEPHVGRLCEIRVTVPAAAPNRNRKVKVELYFGQTELRFVVVDPVTGQRQEKRVSFNTDR